MSMNTSPPRGMRDILPRETEIRDFVIQRILSVYRQYGFSHIETPALASIARAVELAPDDGDAWMLAGIVRHAAGQDAEATFRTALAVQTVDLLAADGLERILDRHADLPGAEGALEAYRRLYEQR